MSRIKRDVITSDEIRERIRNGIKFVMINNKLFDDFYEKEILYYHPLKERSYEDGSTSTYIDRDTTLETKLKPLDIVVFIVVLFLQRNTITLKPTQIANFIGCTLRHLNESLYILGRLEGKVNSKWSAIYNKREETKDRVVHLVQEKEYMSRKNDKNVKMKEWYIDYETDFKYNAKTKLYSPKDYFCVTIDDLDLCLKEYLSRQEFMMYLFFIRRDTDTVVSKLMWWSNPTLGNKLRIKGTDTTINEYIDKMENLGLLEFIYPDNYNSKFNNNPSRKIIPISNRKTMRKYRTEKAEKESKMNYVITEDENIIEDKEEYIDFEDDLEKLFENLK